MARTLTNQDVSAILNEIIKESSIGSSLVTNVDLTDPDVVSVGEGLMASGKENVLNALSLVLGRLFVAVRPYDAKLGLISAINTGEYTHRIRKISYFSDPSKAAGNFNTHLYTNLAEGFTNGQNEAGSPPAPQSTKSMWEQVPRIPFELNFGGSSVWQTGVTTYEYQLQQAFKGVDEFARFVEGIMTQVGNEIEMQKEGFNRMTLLNYIAGVYNMGSLGWTGRVINLTNEVNAEYGQTWSTQDILEGHQTELATVLATIIKATARRMTYNSSGLFNTAPVDAQGRTILRHTPLADQRLMLQADLMAKMEARVFPEIFNPNYLTIDQYESVGFWQNISDPTAIDVTPCIPDTSTWQAQTNGTEVKGIIVVGTLFDKDAVLTDWQLDRVDTTVLEARKGYYNTWYSFGKNALNDFTESGVIFIMKD